MEKMVQFYKEILGFEIDYKHEDGNVYLIKDGILFLMYGRLDFEKMVGTTFVYPHGKNGTFELALSVTSYQEVDQTYQSLVDHHVDILMAPKTMPWVQRTFYFADPEGNLIEIGSFQP